MRFDWWRNQTDANNTPPGPPGMPGMPGMPAPAAGPPAPAVAIWANVSRAYRRAEHVRRRGGVLDSMERARITNALMWPMGWPHEAPEHEPSVSEAHTIVQQHKNCDRENCPRKAAAWRVLVRAGRVRPDSSRAGY